MKDVKLLAPTVPSKVVCIGKNYAAHAAEIGEEVPDEPLIFLKPSTSIVGPGDSIVLPWQSEHVDLECELTVVIGRITKNIEPDDVDAHIWGFTIANDVTARDLQFEDGQWARSKGFDTFCPLGPWIETEFEVEGATLESRINGEVIQHADTTDMVFNVRDIVSHVSKNMTLLPGDIILTGSPAGITPIKNGDIIECEIEGIGTLLNPVQ
jgi:2-keto-4-pentenoate hydratase/2-oxohepta-3-ene-1,7-dioic acid hydratase in catechol pathway